MKRKIKSIIGVSIIMGCLVSNVENVKADNKVSTTNSKMELRAGKTGWSKESGYWIYLKNGVRQTGWQLIDGNWYYFMPDLRNWMAENMELSIGGKTYRFDTSGKMVTGWYKSGYGIWYHYDSSGARSEGWKKINNVWYYFDSYGSMETGRQVIDNKDYYFNSDGSMKIGWLKGYGNTWEYFGSDGSQIKNKWQKINGAWYYFDRYGYMETDEIIDGWYVNDDGAGQKLPDIVYKSPYSYEIHKSLYAHGEEDLKQVRLDTVLGNSYTYACKNCFK